MWACNKRQTASLESFQHGAAKNILGCSYKACNEAVKGDMGLESFERQEGKMQTYVVV